jgi:OmcA/MtrC family decaheme c-type cytochrome
MVGLRRALVLGIASGALALTGSRSGPIEVAPRNGPIDPTAIYSPQAKEHYLSADDVSWIRPGLHFKINSLTVGTDRKVTIDVSITDDLGQPLDRLGAQTPGAVAPSYIISQYDPNSGDYLQVTTRNQTSPITGVTAKQSGTDTGGTVKDIDIGHYTYTFGTALPAGYNPTATFTVGIYARRTMPAEVPVLAGKAYVGNLEYDFRPDGQKVAAAWDQINTAACNNCHDPLGAHGGVRQDAKLCVLCHNPQTVDPDTGNTVDFKVMIHKIHYGPNLPSVKAGKPYVIIGNAQSVNDFSHTTFPQDIRNCSNCHEGRTAAQKPTQSSTWYTAPSSAACGSCHDDLNFTTGANHKAGAQVDSTCASCHAPQGDAEWDASIKNAHIVPLKSKQLKGFNAAIVAVDNVGPGKKAIVTFKLTNGDGSLIDPAFFKTASNGSLSVVFGGPTSDYSRQPFSENASGATFNGTVATYTTTNAIPADATGTWAFAIQTRRTVALNPSPNLGPTSVSEPPSSNAVTYVAVTDSAAVPRRTAVTVANCNACHDNLPIFFSHGSQRVSIEFCVVCHNPNGSDVARRPASAAPVESISFAHMIHRIHTGDELTRDFTVYGFSGPVKFNEVTYPGDRRDCLKCHTNAAAFTPPSGTLPVMTTRDFFSPEGSSTAACLGCHDGQDAAAHAFLNTVTFPGATGPAEACATCHGTGKDWDVAKVHAQ